jgi:methionine-R-sulfoxide reductase
MNGGQITSEERSIGTYIGGRITSEERSTLSTYIGLFVVTVLGAWAIYFFFLAQEKQKEVTGFDPKRPLPSDATLKRRLKPDQYFVVREGGTETAFQNEFWNNERTGIYVDVITGEPLFTSLDKFDGGTGRPTFTKPISKDLLIEIPDTSHEMQRTEVRAKRSNAHLGHLFPDPTSPTGQRYALNSAAFHFIPMERMKDEGYEGFLSLLEKK